MHWIEGQVEGGLEDGFPDILVEDDVEFGEFVDDILLLANAFDFSDPFAL